MVLMVLWQVKLPHVASASKVKIRAKRRSGDTFTSIGNSIAKMVLQVHILSLLTGLSFGQLTELISVEGDDAVAYLPSCLCTASMVLQYRAMMSSYGIIPKPLLFSPLGRKGTQTTSVCSFLTYLDSSGTPRMMLWLERALTKCFFSMKGASTNFHQVFQVAMVFIPMRLYSYLSLAGTPRAPLGVRVLDPLGH